MVRVEHEDAIQRPFNHGIHHILFTWCGEHHVHEVAGIAQVVLWIHVGLPRTVFVGHGHQRRHFGNQTDRRNLAVLRVVDVSTVMVEGRQCPHQAGHDGHGVGIAAETAQEELHLFVDHGVVGHSLGELCLALRVGQVAVEQEVTGLHKVAIGCQLLNRVAPVQQFALVAIDVSDG